MEIVEILDEKLICTSLDANNKIEALHKMSELLKNNGYINDTRQFCDDVLEREKLGETGIGHYVAIPHGQSMSVLKNTICICKLKHEIAWETLDGKGVKVILLFAVQNDVDFSKQHLAMLAAVARKLAKEDVIASLLGAKTKQDIINCFKS